MDQENTINNLNDLASVVARNEVGSVQVNIAQIKEIIKCIAIEIYVNPSVGDMLHEKGMEYVEINMNGSHI